jgi:hypothetical protein
MNAARNAGRFERNELMNYGNLSKLTDRYTALMRAEHEIVSESSS